MNQSKEFIVSEDEQLKPVTEKDLTNEDPKSITSSVEPATAQQSCSQDDNSEESPKSKGETAQKDWLSLPVVVVSNTSDDDMHYTITYHAPRNVPKQLSIPAAEMCRATFLNAAIISDRLCAEKEKPAFLFFATVDEDLPPPISFDREDPESDISILVANRAIYYQRRSVKDGQVANVPVSKEVYTWNPEDFAVLSKVYHNTYLSSREEMKIVSPVFQLWKEVGGILSIMFPQLKAISNVRFIFSERGSATAANIEYAKLPLVNILFDGSKVWDVLDPRDTEKFLEDQKNCDLKAGDSTANALQCKYALFHRQTYFGSDVRSKYNFFRFTQRPGQVVLLNPGVIYQVYSEENSLAAEYNYINWNWSNLPISVIQDSCVCGPGILLNSFDVQRLQDAHKSVVMACLHGTDAGRELERRYSARATAQFLDSLSCQGESAVTTTSNAVDLRVALYSKMDSSSLENPSSSEHMDSSLEPLASSNNPFNFLNVQRPSAEMLITHLDGRSSYDDVSFCVRCNKKYATKTAYLAHLVKHETQFVCDFCHVIYKFEHQLQKHLPKCANKDDKYKCDNCGLRYKHKKSLKKHQTTVATCTKIKCKCGMTNYRKGLQNHSRICEYGDELKSRLNKTNEQEPASNTEIEEIYSRRASTSFDTHCNQTATTTSSLPVPSTSNYFEMQHLEPTKYPSEPVAQNNTKASFSVHGGKQTSGKTKKRRVSHTPRQVPLVEFPANQDSVLNDQKAVNKDVTDDDTNESSSSSGED